MKYSKELTKETIRVFQPYYKEELRDEEALEILTNLTGFMNVLLRYKNSKLQQKEGL